TLTMEKITVIPSEVEGSRCESLKVAQRDPSTTARDDDLVGCGPQNSLRAPDQFDNRGHELRTSPCPDCFHVFNPSGIRRQRHRPKSSAIVRWKISHANSERSGACAGRQDCRCRCECRGSAGRASDRSRRCDAIAWVHGRAHAHYARLYELSGNSLERVTNLDLDQGRQSDST